MQDQAYPPGFCRCGCGGRTELAPYTRSGRGWVKGQPLPLVKGHTVQVRRPLLDRIMDRVEKTPDGCWMWRGALNRSGYGIVQLGRGDGEGTDKVHRAVYRLLRDEIPDGMTLDHRCLHHACCNPDCLDVVTRAENVRRQWIDHKARGTSPLDNRRVTTIDRAPRDSSRHYARGEASGHKLTETAVHHIRTLIAGGWYRADVAEAFGVSTSTVGSIVARRTWAHI
jgi:HNH endonuclease